MPLLDHFHPPLAPRRQWASFHATWAGEIAATLNHDLLPDGYFAEEFAHAGPRIEIDVATFSNDPSGSAGGTATATATYAPPVPKLAIPAVFSDEFTVRVYGGPGEARLIATIELISLANKDRAESRRAFAAKCVGYLAQQVALVAVDLVTERRANLHAEIMTLLGAGETGLPTGCDLYAVAYRPIFRGTALVEVWPEPLALGTNLPTLPLALSAGLCVPLDLEATYTAACRRKRLP